MRYKIFLATLIIFLVLLTPMNTIVRESLKVEKLAKDEVKKRLIVAEDSEEMNFNFKALVNFLEDFKAELDSFPLKKDGDGYINSTFYGMVTLMLLGSLDRISTDKIKDFLAYSYNEETGGFREWLGGRETVVATALGVLLNELTGANITEFNDALTRKFLIDNAKNTTLYGKALALIALKKLEATSSVLESLANEVKNLITNIEDRSILSVFWAYVALRYYNPSSVSDLVDEIKTYLLERYESGGFGTTTMNVFETGLALELLKQLGYENKTLEDEVITFVNKTQDDDGGVKYSVNMTKKDVFSAFGAVLVYYATGRLFSLFRINHSIEPSQQIPIDYPGPITFKFNVESDFEPLIEHLNGEYNITDLDRTGSFEYVSGIGYEVILPSNASQLGFGNHTVLVKFYFDTVFLHREFISHAFSFRIGYNITINLETTKPSLNSSFLINISVKYYNGTPINAGDLIVKVHHKLGTLFAREYNLSITPNVSIRFNISEQPLLGVYIVEAYVNDSYGSNHTFGIGKFTVSDNINVTVIEDNKNRTLGSNLLLILNATYMSTKMPILSGIHGNNVTISAHFKVEDKEIQFNIVKWLDNGTILAETRIFNFIPNEKFVLIYLDFEWDAETKISVSVANITINIDDLKVHVREEKLSVNIGDLLVYNFSVIAEKSGIIVENASIKIVIKNGSKTLLNASSKYNKTLEKYFAEIYVDPDLLEGEYSITFVLEAWNEERELDSNKEVKISVSGKPTLSNYTVLSNEEDREVIVKFTVVREGTNVTLRGLNTLIFVTKDNESVANTTASDLGNGTYIFGFMPTDDGIYNIKVLRASDNYTIGTITVNVVPAEGRVIHTLREYAPTIVIGVMVAGIVIYFTLSYYLVRKMPKRYLKEKQKKFTL